jgi:hypothetical protein
MRPDLSTADVQRRAQRARGVVLACFIGNAALGWFLNGIGAVLPPLRDEVGEWAGVYAVLPGAVLFTWGVVEQVRSGGSRRAVAHEAGLVVGAVALAGTVVVMGLTGWPVVSALGALGAAIAAASLNRLIPGTLAAFRDRDTERAMMLANAYASTAVLVAPLAVGLTIAIGAGWVPGFAVPLVIAAAAVFLAVRSAAGSVPVESVADDRLPTLPPWSAWRREWAVLMIAIVVEFCFAYFVATFLHEELGLSEAAAAAGGAAWGIGMLAGRFAASRWDTPRSVAACSATILVGFVLFWLVPVAGVAIVGVAVAGLGASPLYPTRITALIARFPAAPHAGSTRGALAAGTALLLAPALMVSLRALTDVRVAYLVVPVLLVLLVVLAAPTASAAAARSTV